MWYAEVIREIAAKHGRVGYDPGQIEAWIRLAHGCLDALSPAEFDDEVEVACDCIDSNPELSRKMAESFGL